MHTYRLLLVPFLQNTFSLPYSCQMLFANLIFRFLLHFITLFYVAGATNSQSGTALRSEKRSYYAIVE